MMTELAAGRREAFYREQKTEYYDNFKEENVILDISEEIIQTEEPINNNNKISNILTLNKIPQKQRDKWDKCLLEIWCLTGFSDCGMF